MRPDERKVGHEIVMFLALEDHCLGPNEKDRYLWLDSEERHSLKPYLYHQVHAELHPDDKCCPMCGMELR